MTIPDHYFEVRDFHKSELGDKIIILYQVGSFFEMYSKKINGELEDENIKNFVSKINFKITKINDKNVWFTGIPGCTLERYLKIGTDLGYTIVIYKQEDSETDSKKKTRKYFKTFSSLTNFEENNISNNSNIITCVWIYRNNILSKDIYICISLVDVMTGFTLFSQYHKQGIHDTTIYDDLERFLKIYVPKEIIFIHNLDDTEIDEVVNICDIDDVKYHSLKEGDNEIISKCREQVYQQEQIKFMYPNKNEDFLNKIFETHYFTLSSFCYLIYYLNNHDSMLTISLKFPVFENSTDNLLLANSCLTQLNILTDKRKKGKKSSVLELYNDCKTSMGKRYFRYTLTKPTTVVNKLNELYEDVENFSKYDLKTCRDFLSNIKDLESLQRKLITEKFSLDDFKSLYFSLVNCEKLCKYLKHTDLNFSLVKKINKTFNLSVNNLSNNNFIKHGVFERLDKIIYTHNESLINLNCIKNYFEKLIETNLKNNKEVVKINDRNKILKCFTSTKIRCGKLVNNMEEGDIQVGNIFLNKKDIRLEVHEKNHNIITSDLIDEIFNVEAHSKESINIYNKEFFYDFITELKKENEVLTDIIQFIKKTDLLQCKCTINQKYNLTKPEIIESDKSFVDFEDIRHPLVEVLNEKELYVTNSLNLKNLLLYGTNAVGKTCFIKAIGISVILAQAGFYVPCKSFRYSPFKSLFTRILGNDNIFKGLSTFAVEMLELRTILNLSDKNSLILGDELCSGTDLDSALSLFTAGLTSLYKKNTTFVFATHFHQILEYEEIKELENLQVKHMTVKYNDSTNNLIYDRKLKDGSGARSYGLEVCKGNMMPKEFLDLSYNIRNKYMSHNNVLGLKKSSYNAKKLKGIICESCNKKSIEIHHLNHQKNANGNGYIDDKHHKNHPANLLSVCEECHKKFHSTNSTHRKVKTIENDYELVCDSDSDN